MVNKTIKDLNKAHYLICKEYTLKFSLISIILSEVLTCGNFIISK